MTIFKNSSVISKESYFTVHHNVRCSPRSGLGCECCAYCRSAILNESRGLIFRCGLIFSRTHVHATSCVRFIDRSCSLLGISLCLLGADGQTAFFVDFTYSHPASLRHSKSSYLAQGTSGKLLFYTKFRARRCLT